MRKFISAACIAAASLVVVAPVSLGAQAPQAAKAAKTSVPANAKWTAIPLKKLPRTAMTGVKKAYPRARITAARKTGVGQDVYYKLAVTGVKKHRELIVTADGKIVQ